MVPFQGARSHFWGMASMERRRNAVQIDAAVPRCATMTRPEPTNAAVPAPIPAPASRELAATQWWGAIHAYIRQSGRSDDQARDLTQGFIADVLLGRNLLDKLDERRGSFRTLLLSAVRNYLADVYRHDHAGRRHPGPDRRTLGGDALADGVVAPASSAPETAFTRAWISTLVRQACEALEAECRIDGRRMHWDVFDRRVLRPMLQGADPEPYEALMSRWGLTQPSQVSNAIVSMRRAFAVALVKRIGDTVDTSPAGAREELRALLSLLEGRAS